MKQQIEIDVPEGMRVNLTPVSMSGYAVTFEPIPEPEPPKTKRRPPTKHDLLGVDSIQGWVRWSETDEWRQDRVIAVATTGRNSFYGANNGWCRFAEIEVPADEQPLLERWMNVYSDGTTSTYLAKETACNSIPRAQRTVHMIEVRP